MDIPDYDPRIKNDAGTEPPAIVPVTKCYPKLTNLLLNMLHMLRKHYPKSFMEYETDLVYLPTHMILAKHSCSSDINILIETCERDDSDVVVHPIVLNNQSTFFNDLQDTFEKRVKAIGFIVSDILISGRRLAYNRTNKTYRFRKLTQSTYQRIFLHVIDEIENRIRMGDSETLECIRYMGRVGAFFAQNSYLAIEIMDPTPVRFKLVTKL